MQATSSAHIACKKRPSDEKVIDIIPAHAAVDVTRFGIIILIGIRFSLIFLKLSYLIEM